MGETSRPRLRDHAGVVVGLWTVATLAAAYEIVPASVAPFVTDAMGIDATAVSWLVSEMFAVAITMSIPAGLLLNRVRTRTVVVLATLLFLVGGVASWRAALAGAYWPLVWSRMVVGLGYLLLWNTGLTVLGRFENSATATSLYTASGPAGFAIGHLTGPLVASAVGWAGVLLAYTVAIVPAALLFTVSMDDQIDVSSANVAGVGEYRALVGHRALAVVCAMGFAAYSLYLLVNSWMPSYLATLGYSVARSGLVVAAFPLVGAVSRTAGGVVVDRFFGGRRRPVVVLSFVVATPLVAAFVATENALALVGALLISGFFVQLSLGLFYSYVPDLVPEEHITGAVSVLTTVSLGGAFTAPIVAGVLIDATGAYATAFGYAVALGAAGAAIAWLHTEP